MMDKWIYDGLLADKYHEVTTYIKYDCVHGSFLLTSWGQGYLREFNGDKTTTNNDDDNNNIINNICNINISSSNSNSSGSFAGRRFLYLSNYIGIWDIKRNVL